MPKLQESLSMKNGLKFSSGEFIVDIEEEEVMEGDGEPQPDDGSENFILLSFSQKLNCKGTVGIWIANLWKYTNLESILSGLQKSWLLGSSHMQPK